MEEHLLKISLRVGYWGGKFWIIRNYFGTFPFEFLGPGSFSKILKSTFDFFCRNFHCTPCNENFGNGWLCNAQPTIKLRICHVLLKSEFLNRNNK